MTNAQRREQILEAAREVFGESGVSGTRVRSIADRAGISEPFLYRIFHSKDEIFDLAVLEPLDSFTSQLQTETHSLALRSDISRDEVLERFHALFLAYIVDVAPLLSAAIFSDPAGGPKFYTDTLFPRLREVIVTVIPDVTGFAPESLDVDLLVQALLGIYLGIALENMLAEEPLDIEHTASQLARMFAPGLAKPIRSRGRIGRSKASRGH